MSVQGKKNRVNLLKHAIPYWYLFLAALILILITSASNILRPYLIKIAMDDYMQKAISGLLPFNEAEKGIKTISMAFLLLIVLEFICNTGKVYILQSTGNSIILKLRQDIFSHIQRIPISYFDKNPVGRIVTRVTNDIDALSEMYTDVIISVFEDVFVMVGVIVIMFRMDIRLTLISLIMVPFMVLTAFVFRKKARQIFGIIRTKLGTINAFLSEHISGMKIIQVFNMQKVKLREFEEINKEYLEANNKQVMLFGVFRPLMDTLTSFTLALLIWYGGRRILDGYIEIGTLFAFINYTNRFFQPIMDLTEKYNTWQSSMVASERIQMLLDEKPEPEPAKGEEISMSKFKGMIEFKNVWFAYVKENWVLKDVSFKIMPGESAAFVGATGAGKTSIINLLCGFYENQQGEILIDGINIKQISKKDLRKSMGLVLQDVFLFSGDIETNIGLFDKKVSSNDIRQVAEYLRADSFIKNLPKGYKNPVNERGTTLSAGQRQLLSFARAMVRNPSILLMDEATSNIDTESESLIQEVLQKITKGRTTIAVAHRLSTIQKSDKIILISRGRIKEMGKHQELLDNEGLYYDLYKLANFQR